MWQSCVSTSSPKSSGITSKELMGHLKEAGTRQVVPVLARTARGRWREKLAATPKTKKADAKLRRRALFSAAKPAASIPRLPPKQPQAGARLPAKSLRKTSSRIGVTQHALAVAIGVPPVVSMKSSTGSAELRPIPRCGFPATLVRPRDSG